MKEACTRIISISNGNRGNAVLDRLYAATIEPQLRSVAITFTATQEARHSADYAIDQSFLRVAALSAISQCRSACGDWTTVKSSRNASFLADMLLGKNWTRS
jgi:hypothetical protein